MRAEHWGILLSVSALGLITAVMLRPVQVRVPDPYCEMVAIYQQSGGQYGWPDYRGNYNEVCKHETDR